MTRILIVDDSKAVHRFVKDLLADKKVEFHDIFNGKDALEHFKAIPAPAYQLILLDWEMPEMTGIEFLRAFQALTCEKPPVLMMTSKNEMTEIQQVIEAGAAEYMMKPFTPDILLEKIGTVLGHALE